VNQHDDARHGYLLVLREREERHNSHPEEEGVFGASFPDFPGATTVADDLDTLYRKAAEMLADHGAFAVFPEHRVLLQFAQGAQGRNGVTVLGHAAVMLVHEEEGVFGASFPDFPGATTVADDLDTLYRKAAEMLAFHDDARHGYLLVLREREERHNSHPACR
jgi:predicted RNase H-like HicB family nuclease